MIYDAKRTFTELSPTNIQKVCKIIQEGGKKSEYSDLRLRSSWDYSNLQSFSFIFILQNNVNNYLTSFLGKLNLVDKIYV